MFIALFSRVFILFWISHRLRMGTQAIILLLKWHVATYFSLGGCYLSHDPRDQAMFTYKKVHLTLEEYILIEIPRTIGEVCFNYTITVVKSKFIIFSINNYSAQLLRSLILVHTVKGMMWSSGFNCWTWLTDFYLVLVFKK